MRWRSRSRSKEPKNSSGSFLVYSFSPEPKQGEALAPTRALALIVSAVLNWKETDATQLGNVGSGGGDGSRARRLRAWRRPNLERILRQAIESYEWLTMNFGPDLGAMVSVIRRDASHVRTGGVVVRDGELEPIRSAEVSAELEENGLYHRAVTARIETSSGEKHVITGVVRGFIPLMPSA